MANEPPRVPTPRYQCHPTTMQGLEVPPLIGGFEASGHPPGANLSGSYALMSHTNYAPPVRYNSNLNMEYDDASGQVIDYTEHQGNQVHSGTHLAPGFTQYNPVVPGPPRLEHYAPLATSQRVPNDGPLSRGPHSHFVAMPTQGNPTCAHSRISSSKDFKDLASHYLHNPSTQVETFRMWRRSGGFKLLVLLDVDEWRADTV